MATCPWYVSAHAVRRWQALYSRAPRDFDEASDALLRVAADVWSRHETSGREPKVTRTGAYLYEAGERHGRIRLVVAAKQRSEGDRQQIVDVVPRSTESWPAHEQARAKPQPPLRREAARGLGDELRREREGQRLSIATLSRRAEVDADAIGALEHGLGIADAELRRVCDALEVDVIVRRRSST